MNIRADFVLIIVLISFFKMNSQNDKKLVGYIMGVNPETISSEQIQVLDKLIIFGVDANEKGEINVGKVRKDFMILDSLRKGSETDLSVCFGGWGRSDFFDELTSNENHSRHFARNVLKLCQDFNLAGVDIDWEFPDKKVQKDNFVKFMKILYDTLSPHKLEITIAVGFWKKQAKLTARVEKYIDGVNLMLYDNFSPFKGQASMSLVRRTTKRFIKLGVPPEKLIVGTAFYGRHRWKWKRTRSYKDIENFEDLNSKGELKGYFFDTTKTLDKKLDWVNSQNLGGIMFWEFNGDLPIDDKNSLLNHLQHKMNK